MIIHFLDIIFTREIVELEGFSFCFFLVVLVVQIAIILVK
jgi:hypothetical protein